MEQEEQEKALPEYEAAFIVVRRPDGTFFATSDLTLAVEVRRTANRQDIKHGCQDIYQLIVQSDQAFITLEGIQELLTPAPQETISGSIRGALDERGIL